MAMDLEKALKLIEGKIDGSQEKMQEAVETVQKSFEKEKIEFSKQVTTLNEELGKKEATIIDIQGEIKELKAAAGKRQQQSEKRKSLKSMLEDAVMENKDNFANITTGTAFKPIELKTVANMTSSNLSGDNYTSYLDWRPGMEPTGQTHFRDLVRTINSETDFVQFPRANVPIGEGSFGRQTTEGVAKPQVDRDYTMINLTLTPMAGYAIVSRQSLRNIVFLREWLPVSMMEQLQDAEDLDFANKLVAAATGSTTAVGITANVEKLIYYIKNLKVAKHTTTAIAVDPTIWAGVLVYRPGTDNPYGFPSVVTVGPDGTVRILGVPIYPVNWLTGGRFISGNWAKAAIIQSEGLQLRQSDSHASTFISNELTFLLERTENLAIFRPDAFQTGVLS